MKVLLLNTTDLRGGAARAAYRLHQGLQSIDVNSQMLVQEKLGDDPTVFSTQTSLTRRLTSLRPRLNRFPLKLYPQLGPMIFSPQWVPDDLSSQVVKFHPDIINLHWICEGFLQVETIPKFTKPLVWTLDDMWTFTGGCHYSEGCNRFWQSCGNCPLLKSEKEFDLSRWVWQRKAKAWQNLNLTIVTLSQWLAENARSSPLFSQYRIEVIPNGLNKEIFKPSSRQAARAFLNLPQDKQLILFGAMQGTGDRWKGFPLLQSALKELTESSLTAQFELVVFGPTASSKSLDFGFKTHYLGQINDDKKLAKIYASADVMVVPSKYEAFGQTASESLACGTPVVAFNATGLRDIVDHQLNGYLAQPYQHEDLARGTGRFRTTSKIARSRSSKSRKRIYFRSCFSSVSISF
jgi:glycosyltransferase involved in cell wall biosynthesis